jgi:hypothetical protein
LKNLKHNDMGEIHKTDTTRSPLLQPVISRDYTKGLGADIQSSQQAAPPPAADTQAQAQTGATQKPDFTPPPPPPEHGSGPGSEKIPDPTKPFSFDEPVGNESDLAEGEDGPGVTMPAGSAKAFANFVGSAIQQYLPKATYGYVKIDIDNVIVNVNKGKLTNNWIDAFTTINKNTEEALAIPDENMKMWKAAFKEYLEYKQVAFANPETAFYAATALLLVDQGVRAYSIKRTNEQYMREALEASNPGLFDKSRNIKQEPVQQESNNNNNGESRAA